jgi:homogentisate 1,2-dioxygenase
MHQYSQGKATTQGHKGIPEGHFEEEQGRRGFFGQVSHLIKEKPSTRWTQIQGPLRPHMYDTVPMQEKAGQWQRLLFNQDVGLYMQKFQPGTLDSLFAYRNADGDTLFFCHAGHGEILTEYGMLDYRKGHYILIPKCVTYQFLPRSATQLLVIESKQGSYREPDRGMVGRNAFYDLAALGKPRLSDQLDYLATHKECALEIQVKRLEQITQFSYKQTYFDTVGWKGDFFPFTLHVDDLMPMLSARVHLPPSAHTTFVANNFVVCTFLPRPLETDADALKVPFYHQNIDYDEVLFYHEGDFFSRDNLHAGMMSFHPAGFPHGPHPKAVLKTPTKTHTNEYAVMIDTWNPLQQDPDASKIEIESYAMSWKTP